MGNHLLSALQHFASDAPVMEEDLPETWRISPFAVEIGTEKWSVGTDGSMMLAVRGPSNIGPMDPHYYRRVVKYLTLKDPDPYKTDFMKLRRWAGAAPKVSPTRVTVDWKLPENRREGVILGGVFNVSRLAFLLDHIRYADVLRITEVDDIVEGPGILIQASNWVIVLAGLDMEPEAHHPVYPLEEDQVVPPDFNEEPFALPEPVPAEPSPSHEPSVFELAMALGEEEESITP